MSISKCSLDYEAVQTVLDDIAQQANGWCHFSQRDRQMNAAQFTQLLVLGWLHHPQASLNELALQSERLGFTISPQGLDARITERAVMLLASVLRETLRYSYKRVPLANEKLASFSGILVTDSTQVRLPDALRSVFKGVHGTTALKLQVTFDYLHGQIEMIDVTQGNQADQTCQQPIVQAIPNSLNLFDLGYFKQEHLRDMDRQGAFFVTRYQSQTAIYDPDTGEKLALESWLARQTAHDLERACLLGGRTRLPLRLVVRRLPQKVVNARRRKARDKARWEGKTCTKRHLELLAWDILITNLPLAEWRLSEIFALYPIRWQIELVFRVWKSQLGLARLGNWRIERILCQLYAHLIGAILGVHMTRAYRFQHAIEYSPAKLMDVICHFAIDLMQWITYRRPLSHPCFPQLERAFYRYARKDKRKKVPSTLQTFIHLGLS